MAIPRDFINELVARIDIVDLIDAKVPLKKRVRITLPVALSIVKNPLFYRKPG